VTAASIASLSRHGYAIGPAQRHFTRRAEYSIYSQAVGPASPLVFAAIQTRQRIGAANQLAPYDASKCSITSSGAARDRERRVHHTRRQIRRHCDILAEPLFNTGRTLFTARLLGSGDGSAVHLRDKAAADGSLNQRKSH